MSKRSATKDKSTRPQKVTAVSNFDYGVFLKNLANIKMDTENYMSQTRSQNEEIQQSLQNVLCTIPSFVVFGMQSSGKSSLMKSLTKFDTICQANLGTKCPIEYRMGNIYSVQRLIVKRGPETIYETTDVNESSVLKMEKEKLPESIDLNYKIIIEKPSGNNLILVDLPGVTHEHDPVAFSYLKQQYLDNEQTTVLHVARVMDDMANDISVQYLVGCKNVILVMTHATFLHQQGFVSSAVMHAKNYKNCFIVENIDEDGKIIREASEKYKSSFHEGVGWGHGDLTNFIVKELEASIHRSKYSIKKSLLGAKKHVENELTRIGGRTKPNMKDICMKFSTELKRLVDNSTHNVQVNKNLRAIKQNLDSFGDCFASINDTERIADELRNHDRTAIEGAEGWSDIIKYYLAVLCDMIDDNIEEYINGYFSILQSMYSELIDYVNNPYADNAKSALTDMIADICDKYKQEAKNLVDKNKETIVTAPVSINNSYTLDAKKQGARNFAEFWRSRILHQSDKVAMLNNDSFLDYVINEYYHSDSHDQLYLINAKTVLLQLESLWKEKSNELVTALIQTVSTYDQQISKEFMIIIGELDPNKFTENTEVESQRTHLVNIESSMNELLVMLA